jgi:hypothetical protein
MLQLSYEITTTDFFGLGLAFQARSFIGLEISKEDRKEIIKDIAAGLFFVFLLIGTVFHDKGADDLVNAYLILIYVFFLGFGTAFTLSFRTRILPQNNEITLFTLNTVLLYYLITRGGYDHPFTVIFYIPTVVSVLLVLFKNELSVYQKGFISIWYLVILIIVGLFNLYYVSYFPENYSYSIYVSKFFSGSIFLYVYCFGMFLLTLIPMTGKSKSEIERGNREAKERFLLLASTFNKTSANPFINLLIFIILIAVLVSNFYFKYISENLVIAFVIFFAAYLNSKILKPVILNIKSQK